MKKIKFINSNLKKGYSILEVLVTLLIVNIILLMVSQILVISIKISLQAKERSFVREELTTIVNLIKSDIRRADSINATCNDNNTSCSLVSASKEITWELNGNRVRKINKTGGNNITEFISNDKLNIQTFTFNEVDSQGTQEGNIRNRMSILFTIQASHINDDLDIHNIYRQVIISTRNFYV